MPVIFTETWPEGYTQMYEGYLYNHEDFVALQTSSNISCHSFYAVDTLAKCIVGKAHFFKEHNGKKRIFRSPQKAPFGSFDLHSQRRDEQIHAFVQYVLHQLKDEQPATIYVLHHAAIYQPGNTKLVKERLLKAGFSIKEAIPNHHLIIDAYPLAEKMHIMEKRKLMKCQKAGFSFEEEPLSALPNVYDFVLLCREERGWGLSMTLTALQKAVAAFPENYKLFSVYDGAHRMAATVAIIVNSRILYNFYPASLLRYQSYSPTVMLIDGLYQYGQQKGVEILDLGTSASDSLRLFKAHMGGEVSYKYEFIYHSSK